MAVRGFFQYEELTRDGKRAKDKVFGHEPGDRARVLRMLQNEGKRIISLRYKRSMPWEREIFTTQDRLTLLDKMLSYTSSDGISMETGLRRSIETERNLSKRRELQPVLDSLGRTADPVRALKAVELLPAAAMAMLEAGQDTGRLRQGLQNARAYIATTVNAYGKLKTPAVLFLSDFASGWGGVTSFQAMMVPELYKTIARANGGDADPAALKASADQLVMSLDALNFAHWVMLAATVAGTVAWWRGGEAVKVKVSELLFKLPLIGRHMADSAMYSTFKVAGHMLAGHAQRYEAMLAASKASKLPAVHQMWSRAHEGLKQGLPLHEALSGPLLSDDEAQKLQAAATVRQELLAEVLLDIAEQREKRLDGNLARLNAWAYKLMGVYMLVFGLLFVWWYQINGAASNSNLRAILSGKG